MISGLRRPLFNPHPFAAGHQPSKDQSQLSTTDVPPPWTCHPPTPQMCHPHWTLNMPPLTLNGMFRLLPSAQFKQNKHVFSNAKEICVIQKRAKWNPIKKTFELSVYHSTVIVHSNLRLNLLMFCFWAQHSKPWWNKWGTVSACQNWHVTSSIPPPLFHLHCLLSNFILFEKKKMQTCFVGKHWDFLQVVQNCPWRKQSLTPNFLKIVEVSLVPAGVKAPRSDLIFEKKAQKTGELLLGEHYIYPW